MKDIDKTSEAKRDGNFLLIARDTKTCKQAQNQRSASDKVNISQTDYRAFYEPQFRIWAPGWLRR